MKSILVLLCLGFVVVLNTAKAELHDEAIEELIRETENEIQKYHLTNTNFETDYCDSPNVPFGIVRAICKHILQAYLGDHITSIEGFKAVLYSFASN